MTEHRILADDPFYGPPALSAGFVSAGSIDLLTALEYFQSKLFAALKIPGEFLDPEVSARKAQMRLLFPGD